MRLSDAQWRALEAAARLGGADYGRGTGIGTRTAQALRAKGLVVLTRPCLLWGNWMKLTAAGLVTMKRRQKEVVTEAEKG